MGAKDKEGGNPEGGITRKDFKELTLREHHALIKQATKKPEFHLPLFIKLFLLSPVFLVAALAVYYFSLNNMAKAALDQGREGAAIKYYGTLLKINPKEPEFFWNLAMAHFKNGQRALAFKQVQELEKIGEKETAAELAEYLGQWR